MNRKQVVDMFASHETPPVEDPPAETPDPSGGEVGALKKKLSDAEAKARITKRDLETKLKVANDELTTLKATPPPEPPPVDDKPSAALIAMQRKLDDLEKREKEKDALILKKDREAVEDRARGAMMKFVTQLPLAAQDEATVELVQSALWKQVARDEEGNFLVDDKGRFMMNGKNAKTGEAIQEPFNVDIIKLNTPPVLLAPASGPGSGGRNQSGVRNINTDTRSSGPIVSQAEYEKMTTEQKFAFQHSVIGGVSVPEGSVK